MELKDEQQVQEVEYEFPYHYVPTVGEQGFRQHFYWSWGFRYLGGLQVAQELSFRSTCESLLDIGCGDGRFLQHLSSQEIGTRLLGIDYSEKAISLAKALSPHVEFHRLDILADDALLEKFDVVSLVEVIEHIPPESLPEFIRKAAEYLNPTGRLVLTVPHVNQIVGKKHFQHFDSDALRVLLSPHFSDIKFYPFDYPSRILGLWFRLLGRAGKYFIVTWPPILNRFHAYYRKHCLYGTDEDSCMRIACVAKRLR